MTQLPGILPFSRASLMMDLVAVAMLAVLPVLTWSIYLVRVRRAHALHRRVQLATGMVLLGAVLLFEIDVRLFGWEEAARVSPYFDTWLFPFLYVHLFFAIATTVLWVMTIAHAVRRFPVPPRPGAASARHKVLGKLAAIGMYCTALTGWTFFWAAFVAV